MKRGEIKGIDFRDSSPPNWENSIQEIAETLEMELKRRRDPVAYRDP